jgi:L-threonylcarbamoyladenylate synthase
MLTAKDAANFERCIAAGGVVLFPADTVYGLACDAESPTAVDALYAVKGRPPAKPSAVMMFSVALALDSLDGDLGPRTRAALETLLPGAVTLLLPNPAGRFPLACGDDPGTLGLRVPALGPTAAALRRVRRAILQSSANHAGGPDAQAVADVPAGLRAAVDLVLDAGPLPGTPSTVIDLRAFERDGAWSILRQGRVPRAQVEGALGGL